MQRPLWITLISGIKKKLIREATSNWKLNVKLSHLGPEFAAREKELAEYYPYLHQYQTFRMARELGINYSVKDLTYQQLAIFWEIESTINEIEAGYGNRETATNIRRNGKRPKGRRRI